MVSTSPERGVCFPIMGSVIFGTRSVITLEEWSIGGTGADREGIVRFAISGTLGVGIMAYRPSKAPFPAAPGPAIEADLGGSSPLGTAIGTRVSAPMLPGMKLAGRLGATPMRGACGAGAKLGEAGSEN